jgi:hypothetical protein
MRRRLIDAVVAVDSESLGIVDPCQVHSHADKPAAAREGDQEAVKLLLADGGGVEAQVGEDVLLVEEAACQADDSGAGNTSRIDHIYYLHLVVLVMRSLSVQQQSQAQKYDHKVGKVH